MFWFSHQPTIRISYYAPSNKLLSSDVDRGQTPEDEAEDEDKTHEAEAEAEAEDKITRPRTSPRTIFFSLRRYSYSK